ncbi:hypothetical protein DRP05_06025 [Archaeoglobales archaeon]|nr:MAG: hypothetical protein DRP05_06025 [Archaeoglobales archaeon]
MSEILEKLENIKLKAEELYSTNLIKDITRKLFLQKYNSLYQEIEYYSTYPQLYEDWKIESIISQIEEFNHILSAIEEGIDERKHKKFFNELILKIGDFNELDLWIIRMPYKIPSCRVFSDNSELCFILQIPEKPDYLDTNLLGVLAHEPAHIHHFVRSKIESIKEEKRKVGESLADILAYSIVEYMFTHSSVFIVREIIGVSKACESKETHPSWLARITVLRSVTDEIWSNSVIIQRNSVALDRLLAVLPLLNTSEEFLVQEILKEARMLMSEWIKYKTDENLLSKLEHLSDDEVEKIGEIPKKIRELIVGCTS